jgi:hypothetical protein
MNKLLTVFHWVELHWAIVSLAAWAIINVMNSITRHWGSKQGVVKFCLFLTEMLSVFTSKDAPGWVKLPFVNVPPVTKKE